MLRSILMGVLIPHALPGMRCDCARGTGRCGACTCSGEQQQPPYCAWSLSRWALPPRRPTAAPPACEWWGAVRGVGMII